MIYILPGMGADKTMYRDQWQSLENCTFLNWPSYNGEESLAAVAERMVNDAGISDGSVVVGHSLGGMVGCEIAQLRTLKGLVLIGSACKKEEVSGLLAKLHPLAAHTPLEFIQAVAAKLPGEFTRMFGRSDPEFIRATCKAIFQWDGLSENCIPPKRIHGRHDLVIPLPSKVERVVDGGHMIPVSHAAECVAFVRSVL